MITTERTALAWEGRLTGAVTVNNEELEISLEGHATVDPTSKKIQSLNLQAKLGNQYVGQYVINSAGARSGSINPSATGVADALEMLYISGKSEIENEFANF